MLTATEIKDFTAYCQSVAGDLHQDLMQEVYLIILEKPPKHKNLIAFAKSVAFNQFYNPSSSFNKGLKPKKIDVYSYLQTLEQTDEPDEREDIINKLQSQKTRREMFVHEVYLEFVEVGSVRKLSEITGIPRVTLHKALKRFEILIKQNQ
jgi:DNA-directed RNA polymerase specialized sigma24 family protein